MLYKNEVDFHRAGNTSNTAGARREGSQQRFHRDSFLRITREKIERLAARDLTRRRCTRLDVFAVVTWNFIYTNIDVSFVAAKRFDQSIKRHGYLVSSTYRDSQSSRFIHFLHVPFVQKKSVSTRVIVIKNTKR